MNENRIRRTAVARTRKPFSIRLPQMPFDEKAAFVESICASLVASRFGSGSSYTLIARPGDRRADERASFLDVIEGKFVSSYAMEYLWDAKGRDRLRNWVASTLSMFNVAQDHGQRTAAQHPLGRAPTPGCFPPTLGCGSP